jgi:hypothetical protein
MSAQTPSAVLISSRPRVSLDRVLLSLLSAFGAGMTVHAAAVLAEGKHVNGVAQAEGVYRYRAVFGLDRLISTPQEAMGWGAALVVAGFLLLRQHHRNLAMQQR